MHQVNRITHAPNDRDPLVCKDFTEKHSFENTDKHHKITCGQKELVTQSLKAGQSDDEINCYETKYIKENIFFT